MAGAAKAPGGSAAATRKRRALAAHLLQGASCRGDIDWADLTQLPEWAAESPQSVAELAWLVGVWLHADGLRRSIDARLLARLKSRLGDTAFAAVMQPTTPIAQDTAPSPPAPDTFDDDSLTQAGRHVLLASISSTPLRLALRDLWSTCMHAAGPRAPARAAAQALVDLAIAHRPPRSKESS